MQGRRRVGRVVPDVELPEMWRPVLSGGRIGGLANLSWCKSLTLDAATREVEYRRAPTISPPKSQENGPVFWGTASPVRQNEAPAGVVA
jgi:hypothetical protein